MQSMMLLKETFLKAFAFFFKEKPKMLPTEICLRYNEVPLLTCCCLSPFLEP